MSAGDAVDLPDGVLFRPEITYVSRGERTLELDLYLPRDASRPVPVTVYFHGGGWIVGERTGRSAERLAALAARGVAVASVSYRLSGEAIFPAQLDDARAAVAWLRHHGAEHGLATERIGAWGASAGAHLALLLGTTADTRDPTAATSADAVVALFPTVDLVGLEHEPPRPDVPPPAFLSGPPPEPSFGARLLGLQNVGDDTEKARAASPLTYAADARGPVLLLHGDRDGVIPDSQSRAMHEALLDAGHDSTLLLVAGANHEDPAFDTPAVLGATASFLLSALSVDH